MGKQYKDVFNVTITANGAILANRFVGFDGALMANANTPTFGVSRFAIDDTKTGTIIVLGTALVTAGAAIAPGDVLMPDSTGRAIPFTTGYASAIAVGSASGAGELVEVLLIHGLYKAA